MTDEDLEKFCLVNAGKIGEGIDINQKPVKGRIIAFSLTHKVDGKSQALIMLEDNKLDTNMAVPKQLNKTPTLIKGWYRVVGDVCFGIPCLASSVKLIGADVGVQVAAKIDKVEVVEVVKKAAVKRKCGHEQCHIDWCWMAYAGFA